MSGTQSQPDLRIGVCSFPALRTPQGADMEPHASGLIPDLRDDAVYVSLSSWTSLFGGRSSDDRGQMKVESVLRCLFAVFGTGLVAQLVRARA